MDKLNRSMPLLLSDRAVFRSEGALTMNSEYETTKSVDDAIDTLARYSLPRMLDFFESEAGQCEYEEWLNQEQPA